MPECLAHGTSRRLLHLADAVATDELLARVGLAVESDATAGLLEQEASLESRAKCPDKRAVYLSYPLSIAVSSSGG